MAILRYVAYLAEDPAKLVDFYHRFLGTEELGRTPDGDITITDGFYNLTFFKNRPELGEMQMQNGLHHIGVQVDDLEEVKGRFLRMYPRGMIIQESGDLQHGQIRLHDPECRPVTISTTSYGVPASKEKRFPRVRHIAYNALDPETMLQFYTQVLGLREVPSSYLRRQQGLGNRFCADGKTNLAVFRPSSNTWYIARPTGVPAQNFDAIPFGTSGDILVPADYDGDGRISREEFRNQAARSAFLADKNNNGAIEDSEVKLSGDQRKALDTNGDGKVSPEELQEGRMAGFGELDKNGDGFLDANEMKG